MTGPHNEPGFPFGPDNVAANSRPRRRRRTNGPFSIDALVTAPAPDSGLVLDHRMWDLLDGAARLAKARGAKHLGPADLVLTWLADPSRAARDLTDLDIDASTAFAALANATQRREPPP